MSQVRLNENGYPIKECIECHEDYNIASFNGDICVSCIDKKIVKIWEITEGDFNDVFSKSTVKGNAIQIEEYVKDHFSELGKEKMESNDNDSIGYCVYYDLEIDPETNEPFEDQESRIEYYVDAIEIEEYDPDYDKEIEVDLTNEDSV